MVLRQCCANDGVEPYLLSTKDNKYMERPVDVISDLATAALSLLAAEDPGG
jgi:hypothetical protein